MTAADAGLRAVIDLLTVEPLVSQDESGRLTPRLAERWDWEDDGLTLRVTLRDGVVFHNGTSLDANVVATILRDFVASPQAVLYPSLGNVANVEADGPLDVVLRLSKRSAFLPDDLAFPLREPEGDAGTGPFRLIESNSLQATLERFENYYQGVPELARVEIELFDSLRPAWASLLRGDVDMVYDVPPDAVTFVEGESVRLLPVARPYQYLIAFNSGQAPLNLPQVRRALNMAVSRESLVENVLGGSDEPSTGPIRPRFWAYDDSVMPFTFDPAAAEALLDEVGLRPGSASDSNIPGARLQFTTLVPEGFSVVERLALEVQRYLYDVGVDMQLEVVSVNDFDVRIRDGSFGAVLIDMNSGPTLSRSYELFWRSAKGFQGLNVFGYENAEAEEIFGSLRTSLDNDAAVRTATRRLQTIFLEDPPALFLAWKGRTMAVRQSFQVVTEEGRDPIGDLWRWRPAQ